MKQLLLTRTLLPILGMLNCMALLAQGDLKLNYLSTYRTNIFNAGAAEIASFDPGSARLFFTNAQANTVTVLDISNPALPTKVTDLNMAPYGGGVNSVAVYRGLVAIAVEANRKTDNGKVVFFNANGAFINQVEVGALPDMVVFSNNGRWVLTANEGEPNDDYTIDPEGSVSIIDVSNGAANATVRTVNFRSYNDKKASLVNRGIRIYGPNATVAQDLEPEYIAISPDDTRAYVTLQENNAIAVIDVPNARLLDILPLGYKDHLRGAPVLTQYKLNATAGWPTIGVPVYNGGQPAIKLGGFSGLYFDAAASDETNYVFYTIPDRGPNDEAIPAARVRPEVEQDLRPYKLPEYQGRIVKFTLNRSTGAITLNEQILLTQKDGETPITGKGNILGFDEIPVTYADPLTPYNNAELTANGVAYHILDHDPFGGDFEGIVRDKEGNFWACDENRPSLFKFQPNGKLIERYVPEGTANLGFVPFEPGFYGAETLPAVYSKRWANRGFEAIAYDAERNIIYAFIQSPIFNPNSSTRNQSDVIRILGVNASDGKPVSEYVYLLERNRDAGLGISRVDKIGDAVYTGNGKFLVLERDSSTPDQEEGKKFIFEINLTGATNILGTPLATRDTASAGGQKTLEQMTANELAAAGIVPVHKTKLLNLPSIGYLPSDKPEGIALLPGGAIAVLNDNDFGLAGAGISDDSVLGIIDFAKNYGLDASDRDNAINIVPHPVLGMYQPDAIATYTVNGKTYLVTANEGDAREYPGFAEEARVGALTLDPIAFPNGNALKNNAVLGRLTVTRSTGDIDNDTDFDQLYVLGARSFSIWDTFGNLVFDSGEEMERITAQAYPQFFNVSNADNTRDSRSDNKGPEPEALAIAELNGITYAFVGLERIGGVMVYDIRNPKAPVFVKYVNNRDFTKNVNSADAGDLGPESVTFISAADSPNGQPLLVVANEISGTVSIFIFGDVATSTDDEQHLRQVWRIFPNPAADQIFTNIVSDFAVYNTVGQLLLNQNNTGRINVGNLPRGTYFLRDLRSGQAQIFVKE